MDSHIRAHTHTTGGFSLLARFSAQTRSSLPGLGRFKAGGPSRCLRGSFTTLRVAPWDCSFRGTAPPDPELGASLSGTGLLHLVSWKHRARALAHVLSWSGPGAAARYGIFSSLVWPASLFRQVAPSDPGRGGSPSRLAPLTRVWKAVLPPRSFPPCLLPAALLPPHRVRLQAGFTKAPSHARHSPSVSGKRQTWPVCLIKGPQNSHCLSIPGQYVLAFALRCHFQTTLWKPPLLCLPRPAAERRPWNESARRQPAHGIGSTCEKGAFSTSSYQSPPKALNLTKGSPPPCPLHPLPVTASTASLQRSRVL